MDKIYGSNLLEPVIPIKHAELEPFSMESVYRRRCPVCKTGILLVYRDKETFKLLRRDTCTTCAQRFLYTDDSIEGENFHVS